MLLRAGKYVYKDTVKKGQVFEYSITVNLDNRSKNITIFRARVSEMIQAEPKNMVVLEDVVAISPEIKKINENQTIEGYNASWLWENSTFVVGRIPENFHSPQLFDGRDGGWDCLSCHGINGITEKRVFSLGKHSALNRGDNNACYACHGGSKGIKTHPASYKAPRNCTSCHASLQDNYNAVYIGDEEHKNEKCEGCHVSNLHKITVYSVLPSVSRLSLQKQDNRTILKASASAGYKMKVRGARYYIDSPSEKLNMQPVDGVFDSRSEEVYAEIDVSKISRGKHVVYVEAMERENKWSTPDSLAVKLENGELKVDNKKRMSIFLLLAWLDGVVIAFMLIMKGMGIDPASFIKGNKYITDIRHDNHR